MFSVDNLLFQPLGESEKEAWISKIWKTYKLETHAEKEPVKILHWFDKAGARREINDKKIVFEKSTKICGECFVTTNKETEKSADAIVFANGPFLQWMKVL